MIQRLAVQREIHRNDLSANEVGDVIPARDLMAKNRDGESSRGVISSRFTDQPVKEISFKRVCQFIN